MLVIGERINATNRSVAEAITAGNEEFIRTLAKAQDEAGADFLDVNAGIGHGSLADQIAAMEWMVEQVQSVSNKPLVIDSDNPQVIEAALKKARGDQLIINSVTAEPSRLESIGPLAAAHGARLVALAMGSEGIPDNAGQRLDACDRIIESLRGLGIEAGRVLFDALVLPISVDSRQALVTLDTLEQIKSRYPDAGTVMGLSNISYGLPHRKLVNRSFLLMAACTGLDAVILDPLDTKIMSAVRVADMLTGKDPSCRNYLRANRKGSIAD